MGRTIAAVFGRASSCLIAPTLSKHTRLGGINEPNTGDPIYVGLKPEDNDESTKNISKFLEENMGS